MVEVSGASHFHLCTVGHMFSVLRFPKGNMTKIVSTLTGEVLLCCKTMVSAFNIWELNEMWATWLNTFSSPITRPIIAMVEDI